VPTHPAAKCRSWVVASSLLWPTAGPRRGVSSPPLPIVAGHNLQKSYGARTVLRDATLIVSTGQRVGMVGRNGAGKSTLARILAGIEPPDQGKLSRRRGATLAYLDQRPTFEGDPTARQVVADGLALWSAALERHARASTELGAGRGDATLLIEEQTHAAEEVERLGGWEQGHQIEKLLGHLGVPRHDSPVSQLSGGEQRRVALARLLISRPDLAILDEPTNHLDVETIDWLEQYLQEEFPGALLMVTHDRYLLDRLVERTVEVADGEVFVYDGGYERYLEQKAERLAFAERTERNRQNFLRTELEWLRRQPKARSTKQKARIDRAETAISQRGPKVEQSAVLELETVRSGKTILELQELSIGPGSEALVKDAGLIMSEGQRIGIVGRNGTGKTTLLRAITGELKPMAGKVVLGERTKIAYLDQHRSGLDDSKSVYDNVVGERLRIQVGEQSIEGHSWLERFAFDRHAQRQPVVGMSGGERARVALARLLTEPSNLMVLDEPTNDLDVETLGAVEEMMVSSGVTALLVTHDRWLLDRVATGILHLDGSGRATLYPGNYSTFQSLRQQAEAERAVQSVRPPPKAEERAKSSRKKQLTFAQRRELESLPDAIEAADSRVTGLTASLSDPATYAQGGAKVAELNAELDAARAEVERLMARWEELERLQEG
jgi:ATP-binding cassette subfamily F protein uup